NFLGCAPCRATAKGRNAIIGHPDHYRIGRKFRQVGLVRESHERWYVAVDPRNTGWAEGFTHEWPPLQFDQGNRRTWSSPIQQPQQVCCVISKCPRILADASFAAR